MGYYLNVIYMHVGTSIYNGNMHDGLQLCVF